MAIFATLVLVVLDGAIANVALPSISTALDAYASDAVWVVTSYQLALVMGILPSATLGESLGHRKVYVAGLILFTLASILNAMAPSLPWLIAGRFLQGVGVAPLMALGSALLRFIYPTSRMSAIGWMSMVVALSSAFGPTVGAGILSVAPWPWLFAINVPIGLIALLTTGSLPKPAASDLALDAISIILNGEAFSALVIGAGQISVRSGL
ncbi:MFS transporter [Breoghania sp.]|uniref:MFS transporter n=1 Tax=Breoghania sp. TaxID=2065378 RepID=UPI0026164F88|nr:MFS transporter [Breoghania sp.]MDJ0930847.1 MFS transporter [Breoghania sp.]